MPPTLESFLDTLSKEELELLNTDKEFFDQVKTAFASEIQPKTGLEKAVDVSEKITGGLGKAVDIATTPLQKAAEISKGASEKVTEFLGSKGIPAPISAAAGSTLAGPEIAVESAKVPFKALNKLSDLTHAGGTKISEFLAEKGVPPVAAAIPGLITSMAPDIALSAAGTPSALKLGRTGAAAAKTGIRGAKQALRSRLPAPKPKPPTSAALEAELESKIAPLRRGIQSREDILLGKEARKVARQEGLEEARKTAKEAIGKAEKEAGIQIEGTPKGFQKLVKNADRMETFAQRVKNIIGGKDADTLAKSSSLQGLQKINKIAQEGLKNRSLNDLLRKDLIEVRSKVKAAIDSKVPNIGEARKQLATVEEAAKKSAKELKLEQEGAKAFKTKLQRQIAEEQRAAKPKIKEAKVKEATKQKRAERIKKAIGIGGAVFLGGKAVRLFDLLGG